RSGFAGDGDFQCVVMAVAMRIVALTEDAPVLFRGKRRIVVYVRRREFDFARQINHSDSMRVTLWKRRLELRLDTPCPSNPLYRVRSSDRKRAEPRRKAKLQASNT